MGKTIMARLADLNISARELGSILIALAAVVGYMLNNNANATKTSDAVTYIKEAIIELKQDNKEIRSEIKITNERIDRVLTLKN